MDPQRLPISGATVLLTAKSTGTVRQVVSNQQGIFEAAFLLPDDYVIESRASGFATTTQSVRLEVGQKLSLNLALGGFSREGRQCKRRQRTSPHH